MSRLGQALFILAGICLAVVGAVDRLLFWMPALYAPLAAGVASLVAAMFIERRLLMDFFTMRTTKHGMNMGAMIILTIAFLICANYLSVRHNKTFDLTEEKLNSLSQQSVDVMRALKEDMEVKIFFSGQSPESQSSKQQLKEAIEKYKEFSPHLKVRLVNAYVENALAQEYLSGQADKQRAVYGFIEYKGRRIKIEAPNTEEQITSAMIKATRNESKKAYIITGHGERDINEDQPEGISSFKQTLVNSSFQVELLNLLEKRQIPTDAAMVAIIGPSTQYLDAELNELRAYARRGGRLLVAIDPGQRHNLANLTKSLAVEFANNFIIDVKNQVMGGGAATILGIRFDPGHDITKILSMQRNYTIFNLASELKKASQADSELQVTELVRTPPTTFTINELKSPIKPGREQEVTVAINVAGKLDKQPETSGEFAAVIIGDSDVFSNRLIDIGLNRDLVVNSVSYLMKEKELISIRPKVAKGSKLVLTSAAKATFILVVLCLPLILLGTSGVIWFRRRSA